MLKKTLYIALILFISIAAYGQGSEQTDRVILKFKGQVISSNTEEAGQIMTGNYEIDMVSQKFHAVKIKKQTIGKESDQFIYVIQFPEGTDIQHVIDEYYKTNEIEYAEPDYIGSGGGTQGFIPNDQYYNRQWGLENDGSFSLSPSVPGADIDMENAWNITQGDSNVVVAIIDSGVKLNHPEFNGRLWKNYDEIPNNGIDDDNNGYIDDLQGWDFANSDKWPLDDQGHGSNVAGIIGANGDNSIGYAGVDWNCKLMILKGLENNFGYYSWWANAIYYAVDEGAKVINMSLGGTGNSSTLQDAVNYAISNDVTIVACMMNTNSSTVYYPAGFAGVIAVGSTNPDDERSKPFFWSSTSGSNFGSHISVVAPGNYIYGLSHNSNVNYATYWGGTSQAAPLVSGLAALLIAQDPKRTPAQIKSIIESTAKDQVGYPGEDTPGWDHYYGYGRINAYDALSLLTSSRSLNIQDRNVSISPNPFSKQTTLFSESSLQNATLTVINNLGQTVSQIKDLNGQTIVFNRDNLPSGPYSIVLKQGNQIVGAKKIIITD